MDAAPARDASSPESERYRMLLEINNAVISSLTRDDLFRAIARSLRRIVSFERTAIFLHDQAADVLRLFVLESSLSSDYFTVGLEMNPRDRDRKSTRLNSSHSQISYAVFCLKKKTQNRRAAPETSPTPFPSRTADPSPASTRRRKATPTAVTPSCIPPRSYTIVHVTFSASTR